jgi:hypothetical protein
MRAARGMPEQDAASVCSHKDLLICLLINVRGHHGKYIGRLLLSVKE